MPAYLDVEAQLGGEFLHPGGWAATAFLMNLLDLQPGETVVDLGCGTGATAKVVIERLGIEMIALDASPRMLARARQRLTPEIERGQARLVQADLTRPLPLSDGSVDAIYSESALALTDPALPLSECFRVLRPGGRIATNDRIWRSDVTAEEAGRINTNSRRAFGIPAATPQPLDRDGWLALFRHTGFIDVRAIPVHEIPAVKTLPRPESPGMTRLRRYASYTGQPWLLWRAVQFRREIDRHRPDWERLESYLFFARKLDQPAAGDPSIAPARIGPGSPLRSARREDKDQ